MTPFGEIKACAKAGIEAIKDKLDFSTLRLPRSGPARMQIVDHIGMCMS